MKKRKFKKITIIIIILIILVIIAILPRYFNKPKLNHELKMINLTNHNQNEINNLLKELIDKYQLEIKLNYQYSDTIEKNMIISQSIKENTLPNKNETLELTVSLGKIDKERLKKDNINELGKVPIMMYHGIENIKDSETKYTGGNVDKDGYNRTAESFRRDLEFYYQKGYRMIKLSDYINGIIDVEYGYSPIILTFDDGNENNIKVTGLDEDGNIIIDKNSAVGILEEFKKKYPDYNVTAIFFLTNNLFNQEGYDEKIIKWLVDNNYEIGNHTKGHNNLKNIDTFKTQEVVGYMYQKLDTIIKDKYQHIVALPFGSPYDKNHENYQYILNGTYEGKTYETISALRVGWEPEISPFDKEFDKTYLKRCRAYDNNGLEFDIEMNFRILDKNRYISDGIINTITTSMNNQPKINQFVDKQIILY